jgi:hypothetical protein
LHEALGLKPLQRPQHGVAAHAQQLRVAAGGRQAAARRQAALLDGGAQLLVDLQPPGERAGAIGLVGHRELAP